jgi:hypothetical protein
VLTLESIGNDLAQRGVILNHQNRSLPVADWVCLT